MILDKVRLTIDEQTGSAYARVSENKSSKTEELLEDRVYADYDSNGQLVGIEFLFSDGVEVVTEEEDILGR